MAKKSVSQILTEIRAYPETLRITLSDSEADHELYQLYYILSETDKTIQNQAIDIVFKVPPLKDDAYINSPLPAYMITQSKFMDDLNIAIANLKVSEPDIKSHVIASFKEDNETADVEIKRLVTNELEAEIYGAYRESGTVVLKKKKV
jgi:hypothetical protein